MSGSLFVASEFDGAPLLPLHFEALREVIIDDELSCLAGNDPELGQLLLDLRQHTRLLDLAPRARGALQAGVALRVAAVCMLLDGGPMQLDVRWIRLEHFPDGTTIGDLRRYSAVLRMGFDC